MNGPLALAVPSRTVRAMRIAIAGWAAAVALIVYAR
jgi:hypothetical protein